MFLKLRFGCSYVLCSISPSYMVSDCLGWTFIFSLFLQISCLRAEQTQLTRSLEKERQRAAENRQEYLAAKEEADTQEGRANQLEREIGELRLKHKKELQEAVMRRECLQQVIISLAIWKRIWKSMLMLDIFKIKDFISEKDLSTEFGQDISLKI